MKKLVLLYAIVTLTLITGCGVEQSAKDKEDRQANENIAEDQRACAPFAGLYEGKFNLDSGNVINVRLYVVPISILNTNQSGQVVETPTLGGSLVEPLPGSGQAQVRPIYTFTFAKCYPEKNQVVLYMSSTGLGGNSSAAQHYDPNSYFNARLNGLKLSGRVITVLKPDVGILNLTKIENNRQ